MSDVAPRSSSARVAPRPVVLRPVAINTPDTPTPTPPSTKKIKGFRFPRIHLSRKLLLLIAAVIVTCVIVSLLAHSSSSEGPSTSTMKPAYQTTLPKGKDIEDLGGWKRVSPAKEAPVFAYMDKIDDVTISVSQQPLPESFKSNPDAQVAELAKKFNATNKIETAGITAYIGTSSKGPQSVIFTHNNLLMLMKSVSHVNDASWAAYIESLK